MRATAISIFSVEMRLAEQRFSMAQTLCKQPAGALDDCLKFASARIHFAESGALRALG